MRRFSPFEYLIELMEDNFESDPLPETSTSSALYDCMPPELVTNIDNYLPFEDSYHFQVSSNYVKSVLCPRWRHYNKIQISDDPLDCCIISTSGRAPRRRFLESNLSIVFSKCNKIEEVVMIVKDIGSVHRSDAERPRQLRDYSLYDTNGYLGYLFSRTPAQVITQLKFLSLHVDIMRENLRQLCFPCPTQDLLFSIHHLSDSHFDTFIQISFCSTTMHSEDHHLRNMLMRSMEMTLKDVAKYSAKTDFTVDAAEGYVDMTVEKGSVEYSFAFFYYNPLICEPEAEPSEQSAQIDEQLEASFITNNNDSSSNESNFLVCSDAANEIMHCQGSNYQDFELRYRTMWRGLMISHS